jgi:hypothetical protein
VASGRHEAERLVYGSSAAATMRATASRKGGIVELARNAEEIAEIEMAEPEAVDAVDGGDVLHRFEPALAFDLRDHEIAGVGVLHLRGRIAGFVIVVRETEGGAAPALHRIARRACDLARGFHAFDHRHHHALRPDIERAGR